MHIVKKKQIYHPNKGTYHMKALLLSLLFLVILYFGMLLAVGYQF